MEKNFGIENETRKHIGMVSNLISCMVNELLMRSITHDSSKLEEPECSIFEQYSESYKNAIVGSQEKKDILVNMKPAFDHHLKVNRHHPEYFVLNNKDLKLEHAISQFSVIDLIQMFLDWIATSKRQNLNTFDFLDSMAKKYNLNVQLLQIFRNTIPILDQYLNNIKTVANLTQECDEIFAMNNNTVNHFDSSGQLVETETINK